MSPFYPRDCVWSRLHPKEDCRLASDYEVQLCFEKAREVQLWFQLWRLVLHRTRFKMYPDNMDQTCVLYTKDKVQVPIKHVVLCDSWSPVRAPTVMELKMASTKFDFVKKAGGEVSGQQPKTVNPLHPAEVKKHQDDEENKLVLNQKHRVS